jgi:Nucleoporin FG repeat region
LWSAGYKIREYWLKYLFFIDCTAKLAALYLSFATMAFSFGSAAPAAPPTSSFGNAPTPAPSTGFGFGSTSTTSTGGGWFGAPATAATPTTTFGSAPAAPAPSLFGQNPASSSSFSGGGLFGSTFGQTLTPAAPPASSLFGSPAAPAPLFGFGAAAPTAFGSPPPVTGFGAAAAASMQQRPPHPPITISGNMHYSQLTPDMKRAIDTMHEAIMRHKRTMNDLQSMGPSVLQRPSNGGPTDDPEGGAESAVTTPMQHQIASLRTKLRAMQQQLSKLYTTALDQTSDNEKAVAQTITYAKWPLEALAVRKGVRLTVVEKDATKGSSISVDEEKKSDEAAELQVKIRDALNRGMAAVDRIDRIPSPYYWDTLQSLEQRALVLSERLAVLESQLEPPDSSYWTTRSDQSPATTIQNIIETQHVAIQRLVYQMDTLHNEMHLFRLRYGQYELGENVLVRQAAKKQERERQLHEQALLHYLQASATAETSGTASTTTAATATAATPSALRPSTFGTTPLTSSAGAPATAPAFGFSAAPLGGATAPAPLFGAAPAAPAPLFGTTTTNPAAAPTNLFGSAAPVPLFGGAPTASASTAPASFGNFASASSQQKKKSAPRGSSTRRR